VRRGALPETELEGVCREAGLTATRTVERFDAFHGTTAGAKLSRDLRVAAVTLYAEKPSR
jgi:hypothetical protein